jgi:hypothetical protein
MTDLHCRQRQCTNRLAELEKFSMDSRRFTQPVGDAHLAHQPTSFQQYGWSAAAVQRQYQARCQRMTVSGFTIVNALMAFGTKQYSPAKTRRSRIGIWPVDD